MDADANSSTVTTGRLTGFGGAPNMGHDPHGRRHSSHAWLDLITEKEPIVRGRKVVVQTIETFQSGGVPAFVETLDAVQVGKKAGMPIAPIMIYGDDVSHVVTEEGIAYLYKAEGQQERRRALAAVAGVSPVGLARLCKQALVAEAELTPKPGLVDRRGAGSHNDLSLSIMRRSALAIEPYFYQMALISSGACASQQLRERLAAIGREAERAMYTTTGGSNSHKGAIWVLGLLASAASITSEDTTATATAIAETAGTIAAFHDRAAPRLVTHGHVVAERYGVRGARGEALEAFPHVVHVGLPTLRARRSGDATESVARMDTLLSIMSRLEDTCVLYRGEAAALGTVRDGAHRVIAAGGCGTAVATA
jgi:triphosphoribosyl-dephospho-CoA synthase